MKTLLLFLLGFTPIFGITQEFESDLYQSLKSSSLYLFWKSDKKLMKVSTTRNSKDKGIVEETASTYRKGKINHNRINFNIRYSEYYVVENRKKSLGHYEFGTNEELFKYERTDFDNANRRTYTMYHHFIYDQNILTRENIRTKEYIGLGSVEQDTIVYKDSVIYKVTKEGNNFRQDNLSDPGVYTMFELEGEEVKSKSVQIEGFQQVMSYTFDTKGHLVRIENKLIGEDGNSITTHTDLHYDMDGLLSETKFYDEKDVLLERKIFTYK